MMMMMMRLAAMSCAIKRTNMTVSKNVKQHNTWTYFLKETTLHNALTLLSDWKLL